ncbi:MAG: phage tail tape measure protein, partial [Chelatococcus sp.]|uniref:phage tail tape measure protein n=1 Tax=Chelatococcus sp. TaxID=1953771 RepID=UPI0026136A4B
QAALRGAMAETAREYERQGRAADRAGRTAEDAHRRATRAARQHAESMTSMIAGYARGALTIEAARRAFLGFADTDERLRRLQNQAGASRAEIEKLAPALRAVARSTGYSMEELTTSFDDFRDSLELSVGDAQKVFPAIAKGALAAGVPVHDMGDVIVRTMLNMRVAGKEIPRIIDQWVKAGEDHHIQIGKIASQLPRLTEVMGHWGYEGARGNAALLAWLASLHRVTGSSEEAGQALSDLFEAMTNPGVIAKLGHTPDSMEQGLRRAAIARSFCPCRTGVGSPLPVSSLFRLQGLGASRGAARDRPVL